MDKVYNHKDVEEKIYQTWETAGYFTPTVDPTKKPFTIILPPPNANGSLHFGHAMFVLEDIMIRYHRMKGEEALWLPGADHAGIETQYVYEKKLQKEGKSRFDFDRETLYKMIWEYVEEHRGGIENQLRRLGFSLDWTREKYTLDKDIVAVVYETFKKLFDDGLIYRGYRLVNYCTKCGTGFSELEVNYIEQKDPLYFIKYGPFTIATVRPETKFRDTALAVNPTDKRYKEYLGKTLQIPGLLGDITMTVIADEGVDPNFGTGIMKVTPAHDPHDFELGQKYNLPVTPIIDFKGRMDFSWFLEKKDVEPKYRERAEKYHGKKVAEARKLMVEDLKADGLLEKVDENYVHRIGVCYKSGTILEPLPMEQWFIKVQPLTKPAIEAVKKGTITIHPKRFETHYFQWLENLRDWNISRQNVWGIQIPAWQCERCKQWTATEGEHPKVCPNCSSDELVREQDTFDTWFSSGQWPFATLQTTKPGDFDYFYPTTVMETGYDILKAWVSRMVMLGIYMTGKMPFKHIVLHGLVNDPYGKKMSKSKGNVVNPLDLVDQYGADAVRFALTYGTALGNDQSLSYPKLEAMRKFTNKLWNMGRFIDMQFQSDVFQGKEIPFYDDAMGKKLTHKEDKEIIKQLETVVSDITRSLDHYRFHDAADLLYDFTWHTIADKYIEAIKERLRNGDEEALSVLRHVWLTMLKLLHPFMPFVTEELWNKIPRMTDKALIVSKWPQ